MNAVVKKIETILKSPYDTKNYVDLIREIFPKVSMVSPDKFRKEFTNFSSHIEGSIHVGNYKTPDKKNIIIMAVQLKNAGYVENSRSTQRSYAKKLIENANADAAFIAFYTEGEPKWRLSFVRLDYEMKIENGRLKTTENLTPAKRYSYLVGENEPCHTAISRFERFIIDSMADLDHPTLDDLENAFSVEKVTDEFFKLYCEKFHQLREKLEENEDFRIEAEQHNFTSAQFAKKLMGQIVFLYFLQKKGWLGVGAWPNTLTEKEYKNAYYARGAKSRELIPIVYHPVGDGTYRISGAGLNTISDEDEAVLAMCVKGKPWGSGPHNFMRKLFEIAEKKNQNFFDELLEPLFYDALNVNRGEQGYCPALHCRIPFLSGGLFEPIDGYDWEHNNFNIPNEVFSNAATKGREADGILDIFDRYNFTMSEDEPMEREVAIDPEMLGKVFENLLEVNDRKSKGAFYTPREIVHYMCQESLINYLTNTLHIDETDIREFILYGDYMREQDTEKTIRVYDEFGTSHMEFDFNKELLISGKILSFKEQVNRLKELDDALKNVRVADPAVGSGAFPLGMLNEIVRARQNISAYMAITMNQYDTRLMYQMERSPHRLKYETIKNCIFAVDIEPSAVDIAQLRLWLSLVIDDEINPDAQSWDDGHRNPLPLPNLESNILCGNSLIDEFEGTRLVKESELFGDSTYQLDMNHPRFESIVSALIDKQNELFRCDNTEKKKQLKDEIESLRDMIILSQLEGCDADKIQRYHESKRMASKPYVLWQLDFARVFREKGGFDIVIGNPPYIGESGHKEIFRAVAETEFGKRTYQGKMDFFYFFFHKGIDVLHNKGDLAFITTNYYPTATGAKTLRRDFSDRTYIRQLINFNEVRVFESALGQHNMITILTRNKQNNILCKSAICSESVTADADKINQILFAKDDKSTTMYVAQDNLYDGKDFYIRQQGVSSEDKDSIGSVLNKIAAQKTRLGLIADVNQGVVSGCDYVSNRNVSDLDMSQDIALKDGIFVLDMKNSRDRAVYDTFNSEEKKFLRAFYKNSEIEKYYCNTHNTKWLLYLNKAHLSIDAYPNLKHHMDRFMPVLSRRREAQSGVIKPFQLQWARTEEIFIKDKIVVPYRTRTNAFAYNDVEWFCRSDAYVITPKTENVDLFYLLGVLNSKLNFVWLYNRGKRKGEVLELFQVPLSEIPIIELPTEEKDRVAELAREITYIKRDRPNADTSMMESEIDHILYAAYKLSPTEIDLVEEQAK